MSSRYDPPWARATIQEMISAGRAPDFVIVTEDTAKWVPRVLERIPAAKNASVIAPSSYKWPDFLQKNSIIKTGGCYNRLTGKRIAACLPMHTFGFPNRIDEIIDTELDFYEDPAVCSRYRAILHRVDHEG